MKCPVCDSSNVRIINSRSVCNEMQRRRRYECLSCNRRFWTMEVYENCWIESEVCAQVRWERDIAMQQLEDHGIGFGGIAPDVVKVVRCKDCKHLMFSDCYGECKKGHLYLVSPDDFCSYGERRDNDER